MDAPLGSFDSPSNLVLHYIHQKEENKVQEPVQSIALTSPVDPIWLRAMLLSVGQFPELFGGLKSIILARTDLGDQGASYVVRALGSIPTITHLEIIDSMIGPDTCEAVAVMMATHPNIRTIKLDYNNIGDAGACQLARGLARAKTLIYLSLTYCNIGPVGAKALGRAIGAASLAYSLAVTGAQASAVARVASTGIVPGQGLQEGLAKMTSGDGGSSSTSSSSSSSSSETKTRDTTVNSGGGKAGTGSNNPAGTGEKTKSGETKKSKKKKSSANAVKVPEPLSHLILGGNPLLAEGVSEIAAGISVSRLKEVDLDCTQFAHGGTTESDLEGLASLLAAVKMCPTLSSLHIDGVSIGEAGAQLIIDNLIPSVTSLIDLQITSKVSSSAMERITAWLKQNLALQPAPLKRKKKASNKAGTKR